jgi:hypothetical protein
MITPLQLKQLYNNLVDEINSDEDLKHRIDCEQSEQFENVTEETTITQSQWQLLVEVCHMIAANTNKFRMDTFHGIGHTCGTTHCIAGWAVAVAAGDNDCNYFQQSYNVFVDSLPDYVRNIRNTCSTSDYAAYLISEYTKPFFYIVNNYGYSDENVTAEDLVMKHFVLPIIEIAEQESFQLSDEANRMIEQLKNSNNARQNCPV